MNRISCYLSYALSKLWLLGIFVLVITALFVSALRASLPYLNQYNSQFSQFLFNRYQINLTISHIEGRWRDGGPELIIDGVNFNHLDDMGIRLNAGKIKAHLDFRDSVLSLSPRFTLLEISDSELLIGRLPKSEEPLQDPIPQLFNVVQDIVINDSSIEFEQSTYGDVPQLKIAKLQWLNSAIRHQLRLSLAQGNDAGSDADAGTGTSAPVSLVADFYGENRDNISGRFYLKAVDWQWLDHLKLLLPPLNATAYAKASFELWADFSQTSLDSMILVLGDNQLTWLADDDSQSLSVSKGELQWLPLKTGWLMQARQLSVIVNEKSWPASGIFVSQQKGLLAAEIEQLSLADILALRGLFPALPVETEQLLSQLKPQGTLTELKLWQANQQWNYQGQVNNYSQQRAGGIPQLSQLNARISGNEHSGSAQLLLADQALDFGPYFIEPIEIEQLTSTIGWQLDGQRWWLFGEDLNVETADIHSQLSWQLAFDGKHSPVLSLYGDAQILAAKNASRYLPRVVLSDGLTGYLGDAINGGFSDNVKILWQGPLANFPYQDNSGIFQVDATLEQANFTFDSGWLPLSDAILDLHFKNEAMLITAQDGRLKNLGFSQLSAGIPNLMQQPTLDVDFIVTDDINPIKELIDDSPLKESVGVTLAQLIVGGQVTTKANIHIPLDGSKPVITGEVSLDNNKVDILAIDVALEQVSGKLNFINGEISAQKVTATMFNQPIKLNVATKQLGNDYGVELDLAAKWYSDKMPQAWHAYLDDYLAGSIDWLGKITLKITDQDVNYQANFKSPMTGLALKLPKPLDKYVSQQESLTVSVSGNTSEGQFNLALGSRAEVLAQFGLTDGGLNVANMALLVGRRFNANDNMVPNDLSLQVDLETLKIDEWQAFINQLEQGQQSNGFFPPLRSINVFVERLSLYGQTLTNVSLSGFKNQDYWQIGVLSEQAKGSVKLYHDLDNRGIAADFEYVRLTKTEAASGPQITKTDLQSIPKLSFSCQQCQIADYKLGKISFNTASTEQGLAIENLSLEALSTSLKLSGLWGVDDQGEFSKVTGILNSDNVADSLKLIDFGSSIKDSDAKVDFELGWRGSIHAPKLETVTGLVNWHLGEGHIAEVSDKGARIFSLFSLDSLRRKLVLDFRDVFVKGVFFNSFDGSFGIDQGIAVTHDTYMDGIAGGLEVIGSINLASTDLDYYLTFTPRLFSNIPVVAGVMTSTPQVFILAFALTKVLEPIVDVVSQVNFKLTGNVAKPEFIEVNRKRKKYKVPEHMLPKPQVVEPLAKTGDGK